VTSDELERAAAGGPRVCDSQHVTTAYVRVIFKNLGVWPLPRSVACHDCGPKYHANSLRYPTQKNGFFRNLRKNEEFFFNFREVLEKSKIDL